MKTMLLCLLVSVALSAADAQGVRSLRQDGFKGELAGGQPLGSVDSSCAAFTRLDVRILGGSCSGSAKADCTAISQSQDVFAKAFNEWWIGDDGKVSKDRICDGNLVETAAKATAEAIASVWASALVQLDCSGAGFGCGFALSSGKAYAVAFAEAIAVAAADASDDNVESYCFADIRALSSAFASAADAARAATCTDEGDGEDYEENYTEAVVKAIADAFASASASACNDDAAKANSECFGVADSKVEESLTGDNAEGGQVKACDGNASTCCDPEFDDKNLCTCRRCNGPLRLQMDASGQGRKTWRNIRGQLCFCP